MRSRVILAIDQGTTNTKALLVDQSGAPIFRTAEPVMLSAPRDGFVEQDPIALWDSVRRAAECAVQHARDARREIAAMAISNQRETAVAWDGETGQPLANAVSWQCNRSAAICERLASRAAEIRAKTGLPLAPLVSAGKWAWLLENDARVHDACRRGVLRLGTVDAWILHKLTSGRAHVTDLTNASRTGLLNLETLKWDHELLDLFGIPEAAMPALRSSSGEFGVCDAIADGGRIPVLSAIGDSHAAMFGHGRFSPGSVKATYGTGSSLMALTAGLCPNTSVLARTIAWALEGTAQFALEGNIAMTGSAVQWLGEFLGFDDAASRVADLAAKVPDSAGVYFVPAMVGLGAPYWDAAARGSIMGLGRNHKTAHLARAAVEAIAYQVADVFSAMESASSARFAELHADGGVTRNHMLMQFQADVLGCPVIPSKDEELSALGAAWLAGLALGWWKSVEELKSIVREGGCFTPSMPVARSRALYAGWTDAVSRTRSSREGRP